MGEQSPRPPAQTGPAHTGPEHTGPEQRGPARATRQRRVVALGTGGTFLTLVVFTLPFVSLPAIAADLGAGPAGQGWILSAMSLGLAGAMLICGALGDDHGRRRVHILGAVLMAAGLALSLVPSTPIFIVARVIHGIGGAALLTTSLAAIAHEFEDPSARARATGLWGAAVGGGIAVGPIVAALSEQFVGWAPVYGMVAVITAGLALGAIAWMPDSRSAHPQRPDVPGAVLLAASMVAILVGLTQLRVGPSPALPILALLVGVALLGVLLWVEQHRTEPMLPPGLLREPRFAAMTIAGLATGLGIIATCSILLSYLVAGLGVGVLPAAITLAIWSATSVITALLARHLPRVAQGPRQLALGLAGNAVGQLIMWNATTPAMIAPGLFVAGVSTGVLNAGLGRESVASSPAGRGGIGSGVNNTARYLGSAIGVTVAAILLLGGGPGHPTTGWNTVVAVTAGFSALGAVVVAVLGRRVPMT